VSNYPPAGYDAGQYGGGQQGGQQYSDKSKLVAGLLQIFLGSVGAGRFYTGHYGMAVAQLLLGWLTCYIWPLVDGIMILVKGGTDAQGRILRDS